MPGPWPTSLAGYIPGESEAFRVTLIHALRKTRRLLLFSSGFES